MTKGLIFILVLAAQNLWADEMDGQKELVKSTISSHSSEIRICYNQVSEKSKKKIEGKIVIDFEINDQAQVIKTVINEKKSTLKNDQLVQCMMEKFKSWTFPASPKGVVTSVSYPFMFKKGQ